MTIEQALARQQAITDLARTEKRDLTADEEKEFKECQDVIDEEKDAGKDRSATEKERKRAADIISLCRDFGVDASTYINDGSTADQVRAAILEKMRTENPPASVRVTADAGDKFRAAATDALLMRTGTTVENPAEGARDYRSYSLKELAVEALENEGINARRMSADEVFNHISRSFYNPTAAFPAILDNAINKNIVDVYKKTPTTYQLWTTKGTLSDFKESSDREYILGGGGDFEEVPENGELKADYPSTIKLPTRQLKTFGKQFSMTRQAFINDDIGFITNIPSLYASKAKRTIDKQVYEVLCTSKKIFDGKPLFDASHNNIITKGTAPSVSSIQEIILTMQMQTDPFGEPITVVPAYIIVPVGYEFTLATIFGSTNLPGTSNNDKNPLFNYPIDTIQSPMINKFAGNGAAPWFTVADPLTAKSIQVDYLDGNEMPTIRRSEKAGVLGFVWDIYHDWGINVRDYRGIAKNNGVKITG